MTADDVGAQFSNAERNILGEDEIELVSVGVDIGSSTSHLAFSKLTLEQRNARYVVTKRELVHESPIHFTPYVENADRENVIDSDGLAAFIKKTYEEAGLTHDDIDTGALILTGVAVLRRNARTIGELFADEAGKFVAVSAGDGLEATMAAHGSGAAARSDEVEGTVLNIDIGGGTTKFARCIGGHVAEVTAVEGGARLIVTDQNGAIERLEPTGAAYAEEVGVTLALGDKPSAEQLEKIADRMAMRIVEAAGLSPISPETEGLLRLPPLSDKTEVSALIFSGGVSEFVYGRADTTFGDLGPLIAKAVRARIDPLGLTIEEPRATIRATVIGASQYTIQVSGSTIFIDPEDTVPVRNVPVIAPDIDLTGEEIEPGALHQAIDVALNRLDLAHADQAVAVAFHWGGSATFKRLHDFCTGIREGLRDFTARDHPIILVNDGDVGGLLGLHLKEEMGVEAACISIDGIELNEFDFIDIGNLIPSSGAVPVVIKSLVFPASR
ncbi:MAG: ethanolamine ammonia-lyase reactivating factor EutA [Alphaproteobacteria bacterium]|nr:ethanolamine ammonia-lyase reactivating factor EutA [Alphaproteobacteria bacterium]